MLSRDRPAGGLPMGDPRARRGDRGSGLARARKQPQAVIVGGVSLEATPPARQDYAATASLKSPCPTASACRHPRAELRRGEIATSFRSFGFELQGRCSAFTSWRARKRDPKTFSLAAHNQELVHRHMTFGLQQLFQISLERGLCFNHGIERLLHLRRQIICVDVLPLQFFPCHCLAPAWSDEKGIRYSS